MRRLLLVFLAACHPNEIAYSVDIPAARGDASIVLPAASDPPVVTAPPPRTRFVKGDHVEVEWKGTWYAARVVEAKTWPETYVIHYDGYGEEWDEEVGLDRIRAPSPDNGGG